MKWNHPRYLSSVDDGGWEPSTTNKHRKSSKNGFTSEWSKILYHPMPLVHWTVQIFQDDDWRRKEKGNLTHDRILKSSVWTRHPIYEYHHPRVQIPVVCGEKNHVVIYHPWRRLNENHPLQFTFLLDDEPACALVCCCESCVILLQDLCGIFRCLHRIARADRGQERQKQREKQRKVAYVTEREGEMNSEMEISGVVSSGIAPVILVKTFLPETSVMAGTDMEEEDLYTRQKLLQRQLEFVDIQEEYIKDEQKNLKRELLRAQEEVKRIQSVPLVIGQFIEMVDQNNGIVGSTTGSNYYVRILSTINRELLKPSSSVALHRHSNALVDILPPEADSSISLLSQSEKPDVTYSVCLSLSQSYTFVQLESRELLRK